MGNWINGVHIPHEVSAPLIRDGDDEYAWDAKVKNLIYHVETMSWIAQTGEGTTGSASGYSDSATLSSVNYSTSSQTVLSSNTDRKGASFFNDADVACYLKCGSTASPSSFTVKIPAGSLYELPTPVYTGRIDVIFAASGSGALRVTEFT